MALARKLLDIDARIAGLTRLRGGVPVTGEWPMQRNST